MSLFEQVTKAERITGVDANTFLPVEMSTDDFSATCYIRIELLKESDIEEDKLLLICSNENIIVDNVKTLNGSNISLADVVAHLEDTYVQSVRIFKPAKWNKSEWLKELESDY